MQQTKGVNKRIHLHGRAGFEGINSGKLFLFLPGQIGVLVWRGSNMLFVTKYCLARQ